MSKRNIYIWLNTIGGLLALGFIIENRYWMGLWGILLYLLIFIWRKWSIIKENMVFMSRMIEIEIHGKTFDKDEVEEEVKK